MRLGLSQAAFARRYGFSRRTVQDWEQCRRPEGPTRLLLQIIDRAPEVVERILRDGPGDRGRGEDDRALRRDHHRRRDHRRVHRVRAGETGADP